MGSLQFTDLQTRPTEVLDLTSLSGDEFRYLVLPFEAAFQAHMAAWCLDGRPRTARRYTIEFIPMKPLAAMASIARESLAVAARDHSLGD